MVNTYPKGLPFNVIVRIEFSPVVEIGVSKGHYFPQETTNKGPTLTNA